VDLVGLLKQTGDRHDIRGPVALEALTHHQRGTGNFARNCARSRVPCYALSLLERSTDY
jgi:hypothetical protein